MAGLYIHVPFCSKFCTYCDFYSTTRLQDAGCYLEALSNEMGAMRDFFRNREEFFSTIYIGGGTPSVLTPTQIGLILDRAREVFGDSAEEITIEVNPDDIDYDYMLAIRSLGINRVSIGVQSFHDTHLKWMKRRHTAAQAIRALESTKRAGFSNISLDLIFGFELLSRQEWRSNIERAIELQPMHLSSYQLSIERSTALYRLFKSGRYNVVPDSESYWQYSLLQELLSSAYYRQYEVSSFAMAGRESLHNSSYWDGRSYLGVGPSAHSFDGKRRFWNIPELKRYISLWRGGHQEVIVGEERLTERDRYNERIMLSLRQIKGLDYDSLKREFPDLASEDHNILQMVERGLLVRDPISGNIKIPPDKLFVSDGIIRDLFV